MFLALATAGTHIATFVLTNLYELSPSYMDVKPDYYLVYYWKPWCRIAPFLIGITTALFLYSFNSDSASDSKVKRIMNKIDENKGLRLLMYFFGIVLFFGMIFSQYPFNKNPENFTVFENSLYLTFSRTFFALSISLIFLPMMMGHGSVGRKILGLDFYVPIARLTFGAYLLHPTFMLFETYNQDRGRWITLNNGILLF